MDSLKLLAGGARNNPYKIQVLNLSSSKEIDQFGSITNVPPAIPFYVWKEAFQGFLFLKPTEDKAIEVCRFTDQIEIFDLHSKKSKVVRCPENFEPDYGIMKNNNGEEVMYQNDKTRFAFVNGVVTNQFVYLLYSGNSRLSKCKDEGKYIFVYDWKGRPMKKFILDRYIYGFTVSEDNTMLYAFDKKSGYIVKTPIHM